MVTLQNEKLIDVARTMEGLKAAITALGRLALSEVKPPPIPIIWKQEGGEANIEESEYITKFLCSVINAKEFSDVDMIFYHYSQFFDPAINKDIDDLHIYLWLPNPVLFTHKILYDTPIVAICDAGILEITKRLTLSDKKFLSDCYLFRPSQLESQKRRQFIQLCGKVLKGALILAPVIPSTLLGGGLQNPNVSYRAILNLILLPLVTWHSQGPDPKKGRRSVHGRLTYVGGIEEEQEN